MADRIKSPRGPDLGQTVEKSRDPTAVDSLQDLCPNVVDHLLELLAKGDSATAARLSCASGTLRKQFLQLLESVPEAGEAMARTKDEHVRESMEAAKGVVEQCEPAALTSLWVGGCLTTAGLMSQSMGKLLSLNLYHSMVLAYSVFTFSQKWNPEVAKAMRLMFDFSLSYAGNVFVTLQVNSSQSLLALAVTMTSTIHALVLSVLMMSASVQASLWRDLNSTLHKGESVLMLIFYMSVTFCYGGIPGVWKLASACCRLFMLIHLSWTWILPKLGEVDNDADDAIADNNDNNNGNGNGGD